MRNLIIVLSLLSWTYAQAQTLDRTIEMTYEDLAQELAMKKKSAPDDSPTAIWGFERVQAVFGYSISSMDLSLPSGGSSFLMKGIDVRANGQLTASTWNLEGGLKNYGKVSSGKKSAESKIFTASLKNQDYLNAQLQYVMGFGSSLHWINARDISKSRNELNLSLSFTAGLRGKLSQQLSWGVEANAYSPILGNLLKGGFEAAVLLSSTL